jgi:hypothetical protein
MQATANEPHVGRHAVGRDGHLLREELGRTNEQPIGRCGRMLGFVAMSRLTTFDELPSTRWCCPAEVFSR